MALRANHPAIILIVLLCAAMPAISGSIAGRVTGGSPAEPIVGANVLVRGTTRGAVTDVEGQYRIMGVPPGTYTLVFSIIGYQRVTRPDVVVEEGRETILDATLVQAPVQSEQVVVTASRREQSLQDVPVSISVMDATEIQERNSLTIDEALRYIPGVNITGTQVNIRGSSGYSLGAGSRVLLLLDGIPFMAGDTGELNFESIPMGQVDRIEVVKGASSALYGSNALGGVVNIITKPIAEGAQTNLRAYGGIYSRFPAQQWQWTDKTRFMHGQSVSHTVRAGDLGVALFLSHQMDDGYRLNDYKRRYNLFVKVRRDFSSSNNLTLNFGLANQYAGQFLFWRNLDSALIPPVKNVRDDMLSTRYYISGLYNNTLSDRLALTTTVLWYHNSWGFEQTGNTARTMSLSDGFRLEGQATWFPHPMHTVTFGLEGNVDMIGGNAFSTRTIGGGALFGQDEMEVLQNLTLTLGGRFDFQSVGLTGEVGQINPKAAVAYHLATGTTLRASFGQGFRVPSLPEAFVSAGSTGLLAVPNRSLKPERSWSYEAGLKQSIGEVGALDLSAFRSDYSNLIEPGLYIVGEQIQVQWRNVVKARITGAEASFFTRLFDGALESSVGYTYVYPQDLTRRDILKYRPRHVVYANGRTRVGWLSAAVDFRHVSRVERIDNELVETGIVPDGDRRVPIFVTDLRLGADFSFVNLPLTMTLSVNNLFQHRYVELIGNIMPPRHYVLVLNARL